MPKDQISIRRLRFYLFGFAALLALSVTLDYRSILLSLGQFLAVKEEEELQPADVIHVLGGRFERTYYALQLYQQGYGRNLFFTGKEVAPLLKNYAAGQGIPATHIINFESRATNTYQEALELKQLLDNEATVQSVIVVSSPYHMRRVRWTFTQVLDHKTRIQFAPVPFRQTSDHQQWWTDQKSWEHVVKEYLKLLFYYVKHYSKQTHDSSR